jgi:small GTP-binding protein
MSSSEKNQENTFESSNCDDKEDNNISNAEFNRSDEFLETDFEILPQDIGEPDLVYKIIIIGDSGVGKTCLTYRATTGKFHESETPTLGFEFFPLFVKYKDKILKLELWDTCGQEAYRSLIKSFYINSSMAIIVYSKDDKKSFESISEWIRQCRSLCSVNTKYILIGNKKDLKK